MSPDFEALLDRLVSGGFEFVLVGGYSAMLHGSSLMTRYLDVVCPMCPQNLRLLVDVLRPLNPVHRMGTLAEPFTSEQAERTGWKNLCLRTDLGVLDCLDRSVGLDLGEFTSRLLSLDALIDAKRALGRPRDLLTAEELEMIRALRNPPG